MHLLREQAALLGQKTKNLVEAEVSTDALPDHHISHNFTLVAPAMDNYRYGLLTVIHPIETYPLTIHFAPDNSSFQAKNEDDFLGLLKRLLSSEKTKKIVQSLIAQIQT